MFKVHVSCSPSYEIPRVTCAAFFFGCGPGGIRLAGGGGGGGVKGPWVEIPYSQLSISGKGPATSPSTKLALKYIELRWPRVPFVINQPSNHATIKILNSLSATSMQHRLSFPENCWFPWRTFTPVCQWQLTTFLQNSKGSRHLNRVWWMLARETTSKWKVESKKHGKVSLSDPKMKIFKANWQHATNRNVRGDFWGDKFSWQRVTFADHRIHKVITDHTVRRVCTGLLHLQFTATPDIIRHPIHVAEHTSFDFGCQFLCLELAWETAAFHFCTVIVAAFAKHAHIHAWVFF